MLGGHWPLFLYPFTFCMRLTPWSCAGTRRGTRTISEMMRCVCRIFSGGFARAWDPRASPWSFQRAR